MKLAYKEQEIIMDMELSLNIPSSSEVSSASSREKPEKVIIIGAGPAGMSAGIYAARADLNPLIITGTQLGGQAATTSIIENYPGFPEGISGAELGELFQKNAERFGARFEYDQVTDVDFSSRPYTVKTYGNVHYTETIIIATGARPNKLNVQGEKALTGKGVSYCGTCDGWFFKNKHVIVVGGGDSALEEGLFLTRFANKVDIIHRRDKLRAGAILQNRAQENEKINFIWDTVVTEVLGDKAVTGVKLKNVKTGAETEYAADGVFVFIGHTPNTELFKGKLDMDDTGYIVIDNRMNTNVPGVYAVGESADSHFRQVITSAGMGAAAAIEATRFIEAEMA
jgi:thioredoxin reductase (NADPH)